MLSGRIALITGASRGIGKATALMLSANGAAVCIHYHENKMLADGVVAEIIDSGGTALALRADVACEDDVKSMIDAIRAHFGRLDILVNNAGAIVRPASWEAITGSSWDDTLQINARGAFYCIRSAAPYLQESEYASIVNISSTFGPIIGAPGVVAYAAAKAALVSITSSFAKALSPKVRVNCVCPGIIDTDMTRASAPEFVAKQIEQTPLRRIGTPEEIASVVLFLVSKLGSFVTGQVIVADGGHSLR